MVETGFTVSVDMFPDVLTVIEEKKMMQTLPSFCQLNFIGKSDEATQVKLASDPDFTFAASGSWVIVGGPEERKECSNQYKLDMLYSPAIVIVA